MLLPRLEVGFLLVFQCRISCRLHHTQQCVGQGVIELEGLVRDEGNQVQVTVIIGTPRDLGNLRLDDGVGVVAGVSVTQAQAFHYWLKVKVKCLQGIHVSQIGLDF